MTELANADPTGAPFAGAKPSYEEFSFLDLLIAVLKHKKWTLGLPIVAGIVSVIVSLLLPNIYTATAKILPPQQNQSSAAMLLAQLGTFGLGGSNLAKSPSDTYVAILKSRTVADNLIRRFKLGKIYGESLQSRVRRELAGATTVAATRDGLITIEVDDREAKRAAEMANAYIEELDKLTGVLAITEASQRRLFYERQLAQSRDNLTKAELDAKQALEKGGIIQIEGRGRSMIEATAYLRAQITAKEVQIGAMRAFATENNPEIVLAQKEIAALSLELAKIESPSGRSSFQESSTSGPSMNSYRLLRNVKYHEALYEMLAKQFEIAKIDEAKDSPTIQILDKAIEPDRKSKPIRWLIVVTTMLSALLFAVVLACLLEFLARARNDSDRWNQLTSVFRKS